MWQSEAGNQSRQGLKFQSAIPKLEDIYQDIHDDGTVPSREDEVQSTSSATSRRAPNEEDLCRAILCLRRKLPSRSLEQIIIRLRQAVDFKNSTDGRSVGSRKDAQSVNSRADDFEEGKSGIDFQQGHLFEQGSQARSVHYVNEPKQDTVPGKSEEGGPEEKGEMERAESEWSQSLSVGRDFLYRPRGQQLVMHYRQEEGLKRNFINSEDEYRYIERRVMAKSFIERGYGVTECRKQIEAQNLQLVLHRNTYKTLSGSVIILAYRKLQSFIANDCSKTIKFLDRWQMRSICTVMLNCRTTMEGEQMQTLFKYIRASYALGDVVIGEIESVKLYLACQKFIYGRNVTMEMLERMGEVQHKKNIELTLEYLNRKKIRREQRLVKIRNDRLHAQLANSSIHSNRNNTTPRPAIKDHSVAKAITAVSSSQTQQEAKVEEAEFTAKKEEGNSFSDSRVTVKEEDCWSEAHEMELAGHLVETGTLQEAMRRLQDRHTQLINWSLVNFYRKAHKVVKKAVRKVQVESQIANQNPDNTVPLLGRLDKRELNSILDNPEASKVRQMLLAYFILEEPQVALLEETINAVLIFLALTKEEEGSQAGEPDLGLELSQLAMSQSEDSLDPFDLQFSEEQVRTLYHLQTQLD